MRHRVLSGKLEDFRDLDEAAAAEVFMGSVVVQSGFEIDVGNPL